MKLLLTILVSERNTCTKIEREGESAYLTICMAKKYINRKTDRQAKVGTTMLCCPSTCTTIQNIMKVEGEGEEVYKVKEIGKR